jgi:hemerythrin-like domain-containing protein
MNKESPMTPTEELKNEHRIILTVLDAANREVDAIARTGTVREDIVLKLLDFVRTFADACHHAKEEKRLFVKMNERGMPLNAGPLAVMLREHEEGRRMVRSAADALPLAARGDKRALQALKEGLAGYVDLLRAHIDKEDNILYPMADKLFTPDDQKALAEAFARVEAEETGAGVHEKYHKLAEELATG